MMKKTRHDGIGYWAVFSIGVGGMVGGGIFAVLGLAVQLSGGGTPLAFFLAGLVALITSYSYVHLSLRFPSQGGTIIFIDRAFGIDLFTGGINNLLWLSYIVMLSLYAYAFGSYGATFFPDQHYWLYKHLLISVGILFPTLLNMMKTEFLGKAETWIVITKVLILITFVILGFGTIKEENLNTVQWPPFLHILAGGMIIFLAYEGFELIANTAQDVRNVKKVLPRAFYSSVALVTLLYISVAMVTVGTLPVPRIIAAKDYALAEAARPFLGTFGFRLIAVAAMLSTLSAINATLYGAARLSYSVAKEGELPKFLERKIWHKPLEGLWITAVLSLLLSNLADLSSIATMGSAGFLIIFGIVNAANVKLFHETQSHRWLSLLGVFACLAALMALILKTMETSPLKAVVPAVLLGLSFLIEGLYRFTRKGKIRI
jgi:amino acid transporter